MNDFLFGPFGAMVLYGVGIGVVLAVISVLGFRLGAIGARAGHAMLCVAIALCGLFPAWLTLVFSSVLLSADNSMPFGIWAFTFVLTLASVWLTMSAVSAFRRISDGPAGS